MFIVTGLSLLLLVYVGIGEGKRTYEQLEIEKLSSQGRRLQASIENNLRAGLPLKQFAGFNTLADAHRQRHRRNRRDRRLRPERRQCCSSAIDKRNPKLPPPSPAIKHVKQNIEIDNSDTHTQVILPLRDRFETVGSLVVVASRDGLVETAERGFQSLPVCCLRAVGTVRHCRLDHRAIPRANSDPWLQIGYACTFLVTAGGVVVALVSLYSEAVQGKVQASAMVLSQRLNDVVELNVRFRAMLTASTRCSASTGG